MTRQERLDIGEKIFIGVFVGSIVVEVLLTLFAITFNPAWNTLLPWTIVALGIVFVAFLLYLANWLYSGDRTAWTSALAFAALQIVLAVAVIVAMLVNQGFAAYLGTSLIWLAIVKAVTYAAFAGFLALPRPVQDFLGLRRGEAIPDDTPSPAAEVAAPVAPVAVPTPTAVAPSETVPLTDEQAAAFGSLTTWMQAAAGLLIVAGLLRFFVGLYNIEPVLDFKKWLPGLPAVIEGVVAIVLGGILCAPSAAVKLVSSRAVDRLMNAFTRLQSLYTIQLILIVVAAVAVLIGIATAATTFL